MTRRARVARWGRPLFAALGWALRLRVRMTARRVGLVVTYHHVGDPASGTPNLNPVLGYDLFLRELAFLKRVYEVVPTSRIRAAAAARRRWSRVPVAITFDDDLESHRSLAAPALERAGLTATFFLGGASLDGPRATWWEDLDIAIHDPALHDRARSLMPAGSEALGVHGLARIATDLRELVASPPTNNGLRAADVAALAAAGQEVGFHTRAHHLLTTLPLDDVRREVSDGRGELEHIIGRPIEQFAYPHGWANDDIVTSVREAGYALAFTADAVPVRGDGDPYLIGRVTASVRSVAHMSFHMARALQRG
jgi:peptidoglycan/xylan/chitin deacetylase (PgdA/CDA1 family)